MKTESLLKNLSDYLAIISVKIKTLNSIGLFDLQKSSSNQCLGKYTKKNFSILRK